MKKQLRQQIKTKILNTSPLFKKQAIAKILGFLLAYLQRHNIHDAVIAGYVPMPDELDIFPILHELETKGFAICLPRTPDKLAPLEFYSHKIGSALTLNPFWPKLQEPPAHSNKLIPDIIITPLVAFDSSLNRLGQGKGFYDYTFADLAKRGVLPKKVGFAMELQHVEKIIPQAHDVRLDAIFTEATSYF